MNSGHVLVRSNLVALALFLLLPIPSDAQPAAKSETEATKVARPFGTLRQQAAMQQDWLRKRLDTFLAPLMRKHGIDMWIVPMREYTEDPIFKAIAAPTTFAARRRTIYVFFDACADRTVRGSLSPWRPTSLAVPGPATANIHSERRLASRACMARTCTNVTPAMHALSAPPARRRSGAGRGAPASDGDGGSGGAKPPGQNGAVGHTSPSNQDPARRGAEAASSSCVQRIALGGTSQGGVFEARRSTRAAAADIGRDQQAELWGDEQWEVLKAVVEERNPRVIAINRSTIFAFSDGLTSGELKGMTAALGDRWTSRFRDAEGLPLELIASRLPEEEQFFRRMQELVWSLTKTMFSSRVIEIGKTRTSDLVWWWRQQVNDLGLDTWFQPTIDVQRRGMTAADLGDDPVIERGDLLHCDVGITVARLNTDTQHNAYVLRPDESDAPEGLRRALANGNALQDIVMSEIRPGRSGNEILAAARRRMEEARITGTVYSHPVGLHGHGAGPIIGLWDYQDGVPGRGDAKVIPSMWYSIELQATTPVPEWDGQQVRMAMEEDAIIDANGKIRWALQRQDRLFLIR